MVNEIISSILTMIIGMAMGVILPVGVILITAESHTPTDPAKAFIFLFVLAVAAPGLAAAAVRKLRQDRNAGWIAATIGFNFTFAIFIIASALLKPSETWTAIVATYATMLLISICLLAPECLPPVRKRPGIITDED